MHLSTLSVVLGLAGATSASLPLPIKPMLASEPAVAPGYGTGTEAWFDQLIDHSQPWKGTFKQRYYYNTEYWKGPGSPISFESPSEADLPPEHVRLTNASMTGFIAQAIGGAAVSIEHRFYGNSTPVPHADYNVETLQQLTLENAIDDLVYFARNVELPFDPSGRSHPDNAPWTLAGCSYSGAVSAWTQRLAPGTFWAHEAGSAVVEALDDLWTWYVGAEQAMPRNCSADWRRIVHHIDDVYMHGTEEEKQLLRADLGHDSSYPYPVSAQVASSWLSYWQVQQYKTGYSPFFQMCDYIEHQQANRTDDVPMPGPEGVGLEKALVGFFTGLKEVKRFPGSSLSGAINPWLWQLCNEPFQWWQTDRPHRPYGMVSSYVTRDYLIKQICESTFPNVGSARFGLKNGLDADTVNRRTGGWGHTNTTRLVWVNADNDPWLYATVSSPARPGGPLQSTEAAPVYMLRGAAHCNDFVTANYWVNEDAKNMFDGVAAHMRQWVAEFYEEKNIDRPQ